MKFFLGSAIALGALLRFVWVGKREFWYDEVLSVLLASGQKNAYQLANNTPFKVQEISQLLDIPAKTATVDTLKEVIKGTLGDPHPPLFYLGEHGWMRLLGNSETALRLGVLVVSLITLWVAYSLGRQVLGQRGGLTFTALLSLNPFFLAHSLNLRMYAPMLAWVMISGVCLLSLAGEQNAEQNAEQNTEQNTEQNSKQNAEQNSLLNNKLNEKKIFQRQIWLRCCLAAALTAGLMTQYLFAYWLFAIAALALYLDRKRWFQNGLTIGAGVVMFMPWAVWGVRQQINNRRDVLEQISSVGGPLQSALQHGKDLAQTLANHLLLGHLTTGMLPIADPIKPTAVAIGCGVIGFLSWCMVTLYRRREYQVLMIGVLMGVLPLMVALAIDTIANKYTLGFGWGRSVMVALPGCLLLVAAWLELGTGRWRETLIALILVGYLGVNIADFGLRDRQIFHVVRANLLKTDAPVLVAMNTRAWGHVLRLAYYLDDAVNTDVLATDPADLPEALAIALAANNYSQVLWLKAEYPLWGVPNSAAEAEALSNQTDALLKKRYLSANTTEPVPQTLTGTMNLDRFILKVYNAPDNG